MRCALLCLVVFVLPSAACAADGVLDSSFGSGGKVRLAQAGGYHGTWMPTDVAVQSTGKIIIAGWTDQGLTNCFVLRLNANGTLDTTFGGGNGFAAGYAGYGNCKYTGVAVRSDDRIIAGGPGVGYSPTVSIIERFSASGSPDLSFNSTGAVFLSPSAGDQAVVINRLVLDSAGNSIAAGTYADVAGNNDFYLAHVSADGTAQASAHYGSYFAGSSAPNSDIAYDVVLAADGSFYAAGTTRSIAGDLNCALSHHSWNGASFLTDNTFGGSSSLVLTKNYGGDNNDYCLALALQPPLGTLVLGGQSTAQLLSTIWQTATVTSVTADGSTHVDHTFWYDQASTPVNGQVDTVKRVVVEPYDRRFLLVGSGPHNSSSPSTGYDIGVVRYSGPSTYDGSFGNGGFALYDVGSTSTTPNLNTATSAVLWNGRLIVVGTAEDAAGGTDIVALRLAPFDGIFKDGFEG